MRILNLLLVFILGAYLIIGGLSIRRVYVINNILAAPQKMISKAAYPYELFEALCLAALLYSLNKWFKKDYTPGVYVAFTAIILSALFFAFK